jgi:hypothetical protein
MVVIHASFIKTCSPSCKSGGRDSYEKKQSIIDTIQRSPAKTNMQERLDGYKGDMMVPTIQLYWSGHGMPLHR